MYKGTLSVSKTIITSTNLTKALHTYTAPTLLPPTPTRTRLASAHTEIGHRRYIYIPLLRPPYSTDPTGENNSSCSPLPTQDGKSLATNFARLNTSSAANRISEPPYNTKCQVKHVIMCTTPNTYESQHWLHTPHTSTSQKTANRMLAPAIRRSSTTTSKARHPRPTRTPTGSLSAPLPPPPA
jgi:hypothetical protein